MHSAHDLQRTMLQIARERCTNPRRWMSELASVLNKTKHSIYKKVQGDIGLSLEEMIRLSEHYDFAIDPLLKPDTTLSFEFSRSGDQLSVGDYLKLIESQLDRIADLPELVLWHSGIELPFVHNYNFPRLTAFKFYIHQRTLWSHPLSGETSFSFEQFTAKPGFLSSLERILGRYYDIPSVEFWNTMILDITLSQILYVLENGLFEEPSDAHSLCDELLAFVDHLERLAMQGAKVHHKNGQHGAAFALYHNELAHSNNLILVASGSTEYIFLSFGNPHYMFTSANRAVTYTREWFQSLKRQSQQITGAQRRFRNVFFNALRKRVKDTKRRVELFLNMNALT